MGLPLDDLPDLEDELYDEDLLMDEDSMDMSYSEEEFDDDELGFPLRPRQQPWRIVHRFNPYGRLQLPPVRYLRPGFEGHLPDVEAGLRPAQARSSGFPLNDVDTPVKALSSQPPKSRARDQPCGASTLHLDSPAQAQSNNSTAVDMDRPAQAQSSGPPKLNAPTTKTVKNVDATVLQTSSGSFTPPASVPTTLSPAEPSGPPISTSTETGAVASGVALPGQPNSIDNEKPSHEMKRVRDDGISTARQEITNSDESKATSKSDVGSQDMAEPRPAKMAFEWFRESRLEDTSDLPDLIQQWKTLPENEQAEFKEKARVDLERFEKEKSAWTQQRLEDGNPDTQDLAADKSLVDKDGTRPHKRVRKSKHARCSSRSLPADREQALGKRKSKKPPGYPTSARSAYSFFCEDRKVKLAEERTKEKENIASEEIPSKGQSVPTPRRSILKEYRTAWDQLSAEARDSYQVRAAQDQHRFRVALEAWLAQQPNGGLGQDIDTRFRSQAKRLLSRPDTPREPRVLRRDPLESPHPNSMAAVMQGAAAVKAPPEPKSSSAPAISATANKSLVAQEGRDDDLWQGLEFDAGSSVGSTSQPLPVYEGGSFPTPQGAPAAFGPDAQEDTTVDDLLAGFGNSGDEHDSGIPSAAPYEEELALTSWQDPFQEFVAPQFETAGTPQVLGPQLCIDESGNLVVNESSLNMKLDSDHRPEDLAGPAVEAVSHYKNAYRKTPRTKWTDRETEQFYEALSIYGTDLFLVQTFFRDKSAAQIKAKYTKEMKKNEVKVLEALTTQAKKLTKDVFEEQHGKIDTSKHYVPQPTPEPGEEPEPDGTVPGEEPPPEPDEPGEPEYTEQDESLTTERLMALFD